MHSERYTMLKVTAELQMYWHSTLNFHIELQDYAYLP